MKVVPIGELDLASWSEFCDQSGDAWLFHRPEWVAIERDVFEAKEVGVAVIDGRTIAALCPLYLASNGLGSWTERALVTGYPRVAGPAFAPELDHAELREVSALLMHQIFEIAEILDADRIQFSEQTLAPNSLRPRWRTAPFWVAEYGFEPGLAISALGFSPAPGMATCALDQIVALRPDTDSLFASLDPSCRRALRKAQQGSFSTEVGTGRALASELWELAQKSSLRTQQALPATNLYQQIDKRLETLGRSAILVIRDGTTPVAGLMLLMDKQAMSFFANASRPDYLEYRVNDLVHWEAICYGARNGMSYYRLGPFFPTVPKDWPVATVARFKKKFANMSIEPAIGSFFRRPEKY